MSFILDALKKVEEERRQSAVGGPSMPSAGGREGRRPLRSIAMMAAIAVVSGVLTAGVLRLLPRNEAALESPPVDESRTVERTDVSMSTVEEEPAAPVFEVREAAPARAASVSSLPDETGSSEPENAVATRSGEVPQAEPNIRLVGHGSPARHSSDAFEATRERTSLEGLPPLVLQGTSVIDGEPVAVISDQRVFEGDHIEGALVVRIGERVVELEFDGRRFTLSL